MKQRIRAPLRAIQSAWLWARIITKAARLLARDRSIPRAVRVLLVIGCVQVPFLPTDEVALVLAAAWLALFCRPQFKAAFTAARNHYRR